MSVYILATQAPSRRGVVQLVPGATHLFEEPGALEAVARLAAEWFEQCLAAPREEAQHAGA